MQTLLELLKSLRAEEDYPQFTSPMIFVADSSIADELGRGSLLHSVAVVDEEITNFPDQRGPKGMRELLPVWLAVEFISFKSQSKDSPLNWIDITTLENAFQDFITREW